MDNIGVIPARFGSTRFEGKVLKTLSGKPMLQLVWEAAKQAKLLDAVIIATDDERVKRVCTEFGAKVEMTAKQHSSGTDRICEVVNPLEVKNVVNIQADEPLIRPEMIDSLVNVLLGDKKVYMATLIKKITNSRDLENTNVVKVLKDKSDWALYFSRSSIPYVRAGAEGEKAKPTFFKHIGLYAYTKDFLFTFKNLEKSELELSERLEQLRVLENGYRIKVIETEFETIGVDTPEDLEIAQNLLNGR
ncbi:MAG: 3-deoxy-manno-octulosonate cytidylyltransferase [Candidatus Omnitrophica bacterium]|nr:3-deoxy-manno-octulosonate cytidylyltransferase [Candidatus Omnitrophota bacterium]